MEWQQAMTLTELQAEPRQVLTLNGKKILFIYHGAAVYAVSNQCPHLGLSLKKGKITEEGDIICPWHHSQFALKSGAVKNWSPFPPGLGKLLGKITQCKDLTTYPVKIESGTVWVSA